MNNYRQDTKSELTLPDNHLAMELFGEQSRNLTRIADAAEVTLQARGNTVFIRGDSIGVELAQNILNQLYGLLKEGYPLYPNDVDYAANVLARDHTVRLKDIFMDTVYVTAKKRT